MPTAREGSLKDPEMYEALPDEGASKEKAARISNAVAARGRSAVGRRGGRAADFEDWTVDDLLPAPQPLESPTPISPWRY